MPLSPDQQAEIAEQRRHTQPTLRAVSQGMEDHLYTAYPVLDHGFVRVIDDRQLPVKESHGHPITNCMAQLPLTGCTLKDITMAYRR